MLSGKTRTFRGRIDRRGRSTGSEKASWNSNRRWENFFGFSTEGNPVAFLNVSHHLRTRPMTKSKMIAPIVETTIPLISGSAMGIETPRNAHNNVADKPKSTAPITRQITMFRGSIGTFPIAVLFAGIVMSNQRRW